MAHQKSLPYNFLGLPPELSSYDRSRFVVIPVAYAGTVSWHGGANLGPAAIIQASRYVEFFDIEIGRDTTGVGVHTLDELEPDARSPECVVRAVQSAVKKVRRDGKIPVVLGGEHTVSAGAVWAFGKSSDLTVLQLDAHLDLRESYQGSPFSHACAARLFTRNARVVPVGIRSASSEEYDFAKKHDITPFLARDIHEGRDWISEVVERLGPRIYITIDLDVFDSSLMGAVGTPEPGGLFWPQVTDLLAAAVKGRNVLGFDVVELAPCAGGHACEFLAAKLVYRLMGLIGSAF